MKMTFRELWASRRPDLVAAQQAQQARDPEIKVFSLKVRKPKRANAKRKRKAAKRARRRGR